MGRYPWTCPACDRDTVIDDQQIDSASTATVALPAHGRREAEVILVTCPNPNCGQAVLIANLYAMDAKIHEGQLYDQVRGSLLRSWRLVPSSSAKAFPTYVPSAVREDYEEACAVMEASPKAAATLARRALQGMIRDFWNVNVPSGKLAHEIDAIKGRVDTEVWDALTAVRKIGNIGAHMEQDVNVIIDVEPHEAEKLIGLIEMLIKEWYINRKQRQDKLAELKALAAAKDAAKKGPPSGGTPPTSP